MITAVAVTVALLLVSGLCWAIYRGGKREQVADDQAKQLERIDQANAAKRAADPRDPRDELRDDWKR